jgi:hypothetical protein
MLDLTDMNERKSGTMFCRYRNANLKVGVDYNLSAFSDDLTDLSLRSGQGNLVGTL